MVTVTLYTKPGCSLCDTVEKTIHFVQTRRAFHFEKRNIEDDTSVYNEYKYDIPVIMVNGREIARHQLTAAALESALNEAGG